jgi:hypothetical protein
MCGTLIDSKCGQNIAMCGERNLRIGGNYYTSILTDKTTLEQREFTQVDQKFHQTYEKT